MSTRRAFSPAEDAFISTHYLSMPYGDIARELDRTEASIAHRVQDLGLSKRSLRRWTEAEDEVIRAGVGRELREVAAELGRRPSEVSKRSRDLGLGPWRKRAGYKTARGHQVLEYVRKNGYSAWIMEHRAIVAGDLGRDLREGEIVHHIDLDKLHNALGNLYLCANAGEHMRVHRSLEKLIPELLERGIVRFCRTRGVYELCEISR